MKYKKLILFIVFSIIFIAGIVVALNIPGFMYSAYESLKDNYSTSSAYAGTLIDVNSIDRLLPTIEKSFVLTSAGLQLLGISGIVATILKKDN